MSGIDQGKLRRERSRINNHWLILESELTAQTIRICRLAKGVVVPFCVPKHLVTFLFRLRGQKGATFNSIFAVTTSQRHALLRRPGISIYHNVRAKKSTRTELRQEEKTDNGNRSPTFGDSKPNTLAYLRSTSVNDPSGCPVGKR